MRAITLAASLTTLIALPLAASAESEAIENNIEARQGFFQMLSLNMGTLAGMAKGEIEYDEAAASTAATNIETLTHYTLPALFIPGSASGEVDDTAAKPDIWAKPEDFQAKFAGLGEAAAGAGEAVKGGQGNVGPVVAKLGAACKACHDNYREKK